MYVFLEYYVWICNHYHKFINYYILLQNSILFQNFYKTELNKEEMYIRYIHKLYDLHLKAQNFTGNWTETRKRYLGLWFAVFCKPVICILSAEHTNLGNSWVSLPNWCLLKYCFFQPHSSTICSAMLKVNYFYWYILAVNVSYGHF